MSYPREAPAGLPGDGTSEDLAGVEPVQPYPARPDNPGVMVHTVPVEPHIQELRAAQAQLPAEAPPADHVQGTGQDRHPPGSGGRGGRYR